MSKRGRRPGFIMSEEHRAKIANSQILKRLIACAEGQIEMSPTQAQIGLGLMKKVMPDMQATQISGDDDAPLKMEISWKK